MPVSKKLLLATETPNLVTNPTHKMSPYPRWIGLEGLLIPATHTPPDTFSHILLFVSAFGACRTMSQIVTTPAHSLLLPQPDCP